MDLKDMKFCKTCGKPIPKIKIDKLGRKTTKTSDFCNNNRKCQNAYWKKNNLTKVQDYHKEYYKNNPEKYNKERKDESREPK